MIDLKIDSEKKNLSLKMMLKGESNIVQIDIGEYKIVEDDGKTFLQFKKLHTNREWLNVMIESYLKINRIEVPEKYKKLLAIAL